MTHRFEGHNLEEALDHAAATLGVDRHHITHRVLVEKRGFLGGIKRVVIEAEVNENAEAPAAPAPAPVASIAQETPAAVVAERAPAAPASDRDRDRGPRGGGRSRGGRGRDRGGRRDEEGGGRGGRGGRGRHRESDVRPGDFSQFAADIPEQGGESEGAATARAWCEQVLGMAKLSVTVRSTENDEHIMLRLYGPDSSRFTEKAGELLDAVQVLANKALVGRKVEKEIELDCEEFKDRRVADLEQRARDAADRVREGGREQLLPVMSPIERRIVHLALHDDADVTTESRGDGFYKRVAIVKRPAGSAISEEPATSSES